ncbi:MAG: DUF3284 domain-containing protein [Erysipelotrichia bacterium]|nr:DUF3284 domain-containing protein [Erysipelotrichia bacterium]
MLKFEKVINVSDSEFYDTVLLSIVGEIKQATGKTISVSDLKNGYKYKNKVKRNGKWVEGSVNIRRPILNKEIVTTLTVLKSSYEMKYTIEKLSENSIKATHIQTSSVSDNFLNKALFKIRTNKRFNHIEKYIKQTRTKET